MTSDTRIGGPEKTVEIDESCYGKITCLQIIFFTKKVVSTFHVSGQRKNGRGKAQGHRSGKGGGG